MAIKYKKKCSRCWKNYVVTTWKTRYAVCYDCEKKDLMGEIKDPAMKPYISLTPKILTKTYGKKVYKYDKIKVNIFKLPPPDWHAVCSILNT